MYDQYKLILEQERKTFSSWSWKKNICFKIVRLVWIVKICLECALDESYVFYFAVIRPWTVFCSDSTMNTTMNKEVGSISDDSRIEKSLEKKKNVWKNWVKKLNFHLVFLIFAWIYVVKIMFSFDFFF